MGKADYGWLLMELDDGQTLSHWYRLASLFSSSRRGENPLVAAHTNHIFLSLKKSITGLRNGYRSSSSTSNLRVLCRGKWEPSVSTQLRRMSLSNVTLHHTELITGIDEGMNGPRMLQRGRTSVGAYCHGNGGLFVFFWGSIALK